MQGVISSKPRGAIMQKRPFPLTKIYSKIKSESRTRGQDTFAQVAGTFTHAGIPIWLQSNIIGYSAHMTSESPCNRSSWLRRNKQKKHFFNLWPQTYFRLLTQWETVVKMPFLTANISTTHNLET